MKEVDEKATINTTRMFAAAALTEREKVVLPSRTEAIRAARELGLN